MHLSHILPLVVALAADTALGHMNMADPPPLRYKGNPNAVKAGKIDSDITSPNTAATFPCKGALPDLDDPVAGAPVATWYPGEQHTVRIEGGASHNGGSCQLALSYDRGKTFTVVFSKIGACPTDPAIPFTLPADTPSADKVLFAWSWINHTGNREFYNNCAVLTIGAAAKKQNKRAATTPAVAFKDRPAMLVANLYHTAGSACVKEGFDALYPDPGPDFINVSTSAELPDDCVTGQPLSAGSNGSGSAGGAPASGSANGGAPAGPGATVSSPSGPAPTSASDPGGIFVTSSTLRDSAPAPTDATTTKTPIASGGGGGGRPSVSVTSSRVGGGKPSPSASSTRSAAPPSGTGSAGGGSGSGSGDGGAAGGSLSGACQPEGEWNCLTGGASWQRCASGLWSVVMPMPAGTTCTPGQSSSLNRRSRAIHRREPVRRRARVVAWNW